MFNKGSSSNLHLKEAFQRGKEKQRRKESRLLCKTAFLER
jgi:hypothetical protein